MKTLSFTALFLLVLLTLSGCKDDVKPQPTEAEKITVLLTSGTGKWAPSSTKGITVDGVDVTDDLFKDFTITFTNDRISTTGTTPVWLREDTWHFKDNSATIMIRGQDDNEIHIKSISESELQLSLDWDQTTYDEGGKSKSIPGKFLFTLSK